MTEIIGVRFAHASKVYYFDADGLGVKPGDNVIVETARGTEFGTVTGIPEDAARNNHRQLKKVLRAATEKDVIRNRENAERAESALKTCEEKIAEHDLDMKLVDVEYTFDRSKVIFYFTANGRVDFRELVKDLASVFKMRIELRQIGVRDEAKMMGGIGNCGRSLCCHQWMADFQPVSIKMAKTQNLSLNPTKISGICGRLMCCLQFENEVYTELGKGMPKVGEHVETPEGDAVVTDVNILLDSVKCRLIETEEDEEGKTIEKFVGEPVTFTKEEIQRQRPKRQKSSRKPRKKGKPGQEAQGKSDKEQQAKSGQEQQARSDKEQQGKPDRESRERPRREQGRSRQDRPKRPREEREGKTQQRRQDASRPEQQDRPGQGPQN